MTQPMVRSHDLATNEIIDREMNAEELAHYEASKAKAEARITAEAEAEAAKAAAQAKLAALGLSPDDLKALGLGGNE